MTSPFTLTIGCELRFHPRGEGVLMLQLEGARCSGQDVRNESLDVSGDGRDIAVESYAGPEGGNRYLRIRLAPGVAETVTVAYRAEARIAPLLQDPATVTEIPVGDIPFAVQRYLLASRYCQSDKLERLAMQEFGRLAPGHGRITAICNWIYGHIDYVKGSSDANTTVHDTLVSRAGVCRDFAHLGIALCRALSIPARFVSAYAAGLQPPDFHAVFEAYLSGRWYLFDATRQASLDRMVRIGVGRDATDVSFATIYGDIEPTTPTVIARVEPEAAPGAPMPATLQAVSFSER